MGSQQSQPEPEGQAEEGGQAEAPGDCYPGGVADALLAEDLPKGALLPEGLPGRGHVPTHLGRRREGGDPHIEQAGPEQPVGDPAEGERSLRPLRSAAGPRARMSRPAIASPPQ